MNTNCKFEPDLIQKYAEGTIDPLEKIFVEEHIKVCRNCRKELTEMKLLFWELQDIDKTEPEIPPEMDELREKAVDRIFEGEPSKYGFKEFLKHQKKVLSDMGSFVNFIPGTSEGKTIAKKAPSVLYRLSGKAFKGSLKIIGTRI